MDPSSSGKNVYCHSVSVLMCIYQKLTGISKKIPRHENGHIDWSWLLLQGNSHGFINVHIYFLETFTNIARNSEDSFLTWYTTYILTTHYSIVILTAMNTQYICIYNNTKRLPWCDETCITLLLKKCVHVGFLQVVRAGSYHISQIWRVLCVTASYLNRDDPWNCSLCS